MAVRLRNVEHIRVCGGKNTVCHWPLFGGIWYWGDDEILLGHIHAPCSYQDPAEVGHGPHNIWERAVVRLQRSLDLGRTWPEDPADWWLPPKLEPLERPAFVTATRDSSYTNYRYWPELLSSGLLPPEQATRIVEARLNAGGQFCGMTRFCQWLDDWPLAEYLEGLWALGRKDDFLLSLYGHVAYHQAEGHLTAYEQVSFPPGRERAAYCLPCQLVAPRAARRLIG